MQSSPTSIGPGARLSTSSWASWFSPSRFALLLGLFIFAAFPQIVLGWQTFVIRDFGFFVHPLAYFQRECFWQGQLPRWDPYNNCGVPFLAQWNTMPLYPPVLFYLVLPLTWALGMFCLLHLWFAGFGMYWLVRRWTGHNFAAAFAGVAFAFNGLTLNLLMWPSHLATLSWMPWVVLVVERAWREGGRRIPLAALVGAMQMLAGGPEIILFTWLFLVVLWLAQFWRGEVTRTAMLWRFPLVVLLVAALAAAQLLPFLDLAAHSQRGSGYADTRWSVPGRGWVNFLVPMAFGRIWHIGVFFQHGQWWTSSYYLGLATLLLALLAIWTVRDRRVWLLTLVAAAAFLFALGDQTFIYRGLRRLIPQLSLMTYPIKYVILIVFVTPILAAYALARMVRIPHETANDRSRRREEADSQEGERQESLYTGDRDPINPQVAQPKIGTRRIVLIGSVLFALIVGILFWLWRWPLPNDDTQAALFNGLTRGVFLLAVVGLLVLLSKPNQRAWSGWIPLALLLVAWLDVLTHEPTQNPTIAPWVYQPGLARSRLAMKPQPALGESRAMVSPLAASEFRKLTMNDPQNNFLVKRMGYFADCNLLDAVPKVNGFFSLYPREGGEVTSLLYTTTNAPFPGLLDFMGVSQITAPDQFAKWQARNTFMPLVTAGQRPVFLNDTNTLYAMMRPDFDGRKVVFLPPTVRSRVTVTNATSAQVIRSHFDRERVEVGVETDQPSLVVLAQTYYHCWRAYVDDRPAPLLRANCAFQAVEVPAGRHRVRVVYEDRAFNTGVMISAVALLGCGLWLAMQRKQKDRARGEVRD